MKKALIVDDTMYIRSEIRELLEEQGYTTYEAADGLEAINNYP